MGADTDLRTAAALCQLGCVDASLLAVETFLIARAKLAPQDERSFASRSHFLPTELQQTLVVLLARGCDLLTPSANIGLPTGLFGRDKSLVC